MLFLISHGRGLFQAECTWLIQSSELYIEWRGFVGLQSKGFQCKTATSCFAGKGRFELGNCVVDVSLCYLPQDLPAEMLADYARLLLNTGIDRLEMPFALWHRLRRYLRPEKITVVIRNPQEREQAYRQGVRSFLTDAELFVDRFSGNCPDIWVKIPVDDEGTIQADIQQAAHCAGIRAAGFANGMMGDYPQAFQRIRRAAGSLDVNDNAHLAVAASLEWLLSGGEQAIAAFGGVGKHAPLEQLLMARHIVCGVPVSLKEIPQLRSLFAKLSGRTVSPYAPVMGKNIFFYESGIHADGIHKNPKTYEPFSPEEVSMTRHLSIGKHSGKTALRIKMAQLGVHLSEEKLDILNTKVREESTKLRRGFTDTELLNLGCLVQRESLHG